ncbi:hypothetical protein LF41_656 [Lysobacter dokdonensis DS-58]|uniref:Type 4 fimbrial biogenesis protein PilX N-terminal domain-containing protein n=1 Tax=Lysobacter dokdonensis DS-58 TaxID=1300345 RepID=A0A0A2WEJ2_9GAMM|nr:hypothetical protein [Lysobacter dokdonensis]KGQ18626.1 hypothetical protein LF41_656 [Lysobacter dokdonensis DS-58]
MHASNGNALVAALLVLLLASVATLLTLHVGVFEQRATGNLVRSRVAAELAEAAVAHGAAWIAGDPMRLAHGAQWQRCADLVEADAFPCGAVADGTQRAGMYFWTEVGGDRDGDGGVDVFDARMLPLTDGRITQVGAFDRVAHGAGVVLCRTARETPARCTTDPAEEGGDVAYTVVGLGRLVDEGARATVTQRFARTAAFAPNPRMPPVIASGSVDLRTPLNVVANPNAGGHGVPISAWSRRDVLKSAANTCHPGEFFDGAAAAFQSGSLTCDDCRCPLAGGLVDTHDPEGVDILDVDGSDGSNALGVNLDLEPGGFPCDLFAQVFGVVARIDADADAFCESRAPQVAYVAPATMGRMQLTADDAFLYRHAKRIIPRDAAAAALMRRNQALVESYPSPALAGLVWCQRACDIGSGDGLGTPAAPVLLVADGPLHVHGRVFGLVFVRDDGDALDPATGGNARLRLHGSAAIYGAVVVQGSVDQASGARAIVSAPDVIANLADTIPAVHAPVPGAWSDHVSY